MHVTGTSRCVPGPAGVSGFHTRNGQAVAGKVFADKLRTMSSIRLVGVLLGSVVACGCSTGGADLGTDGGEVGSSSGTGGVENRGVGGARDVELPSASGAGGAAQNADACTGEPVAVPIESGHALASATYVASALQAGVRPDPSLLRRAEFQAYFAPPAGSTPGGFGRFSVSGDDSAVLEVASVGNVPATTTPVSLIVIVDESSTMHEELPIAADLLSAMFTAPVGGLGSAPGDRLTVIEWRDEVATVVSAEPAGSAKATSAPEVIRARATEQLAGAPSFPALGDAVQAAIDGTLDAAPHVVMLTDGGLAVNDEMRAQVDRWRVVAATSIVELHDVAEGPMPHRRAVMEPFVDGVQVYVGSRGGVAPVFASRLFGDRFGEMFRVRKVVAGTVAGDGFQVVPPQDVLDPNATPGFGPWVGDGGTSFMRPAVTFCGLGLPDVVGVVAIGVDPAATFTARQFGWAPVDPLGTLSEARAARMEVVDRLVDQIGGVCPPDAEAVTKLVTDIDLLRTSTSLSGVDLSEHQTALMEMSQWAVAHKLACK